MKTGTKSNEKNQPASRPAAVVQRSATKLTPTPSPMVQRHAFVGSTQISGTTPGLTPAMQSFATDTKIRQYKDQKEFEDHAAGSKDYMGNLVNPPDTAFKDVWIRFSETGTNVLGEYHTKVPLADVLEAVGSKSFVRERFSTDNMTTTPNMEAAYEAENQAEFVRMGIDTEPDKTKFGGESLFPKMGFALTKYGMPVFANPTRVAELSSGGYTGIPVQRYLKLAWAWTKDNEADVTAKKASGATIITERETLDNVQKGLSSQLDPFISGLSTGGHLGDELSKPANATLFTPLLDFSVAFTDVIVQMAATESSSRLSTAERTALTSSGTLPAADKSKLFGEWRNHYFEDTTKAAISSGVRYAGMGLFHYNDIISRGLPTGAFTYDMVNTELNAFAAETKRLEGLAKP